MTVAVESQKVGQKQEYSYHFQNEHGEEWIATIKGKTLYVKKQVDGFQEIQLSVEEVTAELDGAFDGEYDFEESCSLRSLEFTSSESYWILSVLLSSIETMKKN